MGPIGNVIVDNRVQKVEDHLGGHINILVLIISPKVEREMIIDFSKSGTACYLKLEVVYKKLSECSRTS